MAFVVSNIEHLVVNYLQASNHNLEQALSLLTDRQDHNASYKVHAVCL